MKNQRHTKIDSKIESCSYPLKCKVTKLAQKEKDAFRVLILFFAGEPRRTRTYNPLIKSQRGRCGSALRLVAFAAS